MSSSRGSRRGKRRRDKISSRNKIAAHNKIAGPVRMPEALPSAPSAEPPAPVKRRKTPRKRRHTFLSRFISWRRAFQLVLGLAVYIAIGRFGLSLWWVVIFGSVGGVLLGKFFCRWMCPLGFMMETMMGMAPSDDQAGMYQYFKLGCPIAWISGLLNRVSLLRVKENENPCASCGRCDDVCYISTHNEGYSLWEAGKLNPSEHYACSRCLRCVEVCPTNKLTVGLVTGVGGRQPMREDASASRDSSAVVASGPS